MNNIIDSITSTLDFYNPYFKQFKKHLNGKDIAILESTPSKAYEVFTNEEYAITCISNLNELREHTNLNGIIINNFFCDNLERLINETFESLKNDGIMLLIFNNQVYEKDTVNYFLKNKFDIIEELIGDDKWNFILYSKKTTK